MLELFGNAILAICSRISPRGNDKRVIGRTIRDWFFNRRRAIGLDDTPCRAGRGRLGNRWRTAGRTLDDGCASRCWLRDLRVARGLVFQTELRRNAGRADRYAVYQYSELIGRRGVGTVLRLDAPLVLQILIESYVGGIGGIFVVLNPAAAKST